MVGLIDDKKGFATVSEGVFPVGVGKIASPYITGKYKFGPWWCTSKCVVNLVAKAVEL